MTGRPAVLVLLAAVCAAAGCGIPTDGAAHPLPAGAIPPGAPPGAAVTAPGNPGPAQGVIFLNKGGRLVGVSTPTGDGSPTAALTALLAWPPGGKNELRTAINEKTRLVGPVRVAAGVASVYLTRDFVDLPPRDEVIAVGQIVYTTTTSSAITAVRFFVDGDAIEVPQGDGRLVTGPVGRSDYPDLLAGGSSRNCNTSGSGSVTCG
jgi:hypothetical protein